MKCRTIWHAGDLNILDVLEPKKSSRWDVSDKEKEKKDSISEFISLARSKADVQQQPPVPAKEECGIGTTETPPTVVSLQQGLNLKGIAVNLDNPDIRWVNALIVLTQISLHKSQLSMSKGLG